MVYEEKKIVRGPYGPGKQFGGAAPLVQKPVMSLHKFISHECQRDNTIVYSLAKDEMSANMGTLNGRLRAAHISKTARRLPGTVAYPRVPRMLPVKSLGYRRVPSGTSAHQRAILLMLIGAVSRQYWTSHWADRLCSSSGGHQIRTWIVTEIRQYTHTKNLHDTRDRDT